MNKLLSALSRLPAPDDYFRGRGSHAPALPNNILFFARMSRSDLLRRTFASWPHHRFVLITCLRVPGVVHVDSLSVRLSVGESLLIFPFQFHHYSDLNSDDIRWLFLSFELAETTTLAHLRDTPFPLSAKGFSYFCDAVEAFGSKERDDEVQLKTALFLSYLRSLQLPDRTNVLEMHPDADGMLLKRIHAIIHENNEGLPKIDHLAVRLGLSESRLREVFRKRFGLSLGAYLRRHRLTRMIALLSRSNLSLTQIAYECGYQSLPAFSRAFLRMTGIPPSQYRRQKKSISLTAL